MKKIKKQLILIILMAVLSACSRSAGSIETAALNDGNEDGGAQNDQDYTFTASINPENTNVYSSVFNETINDINVSQRRGDGSDVIIGPVVFTQNGIEYAAIMSIDGYDISIEAYKAGDNTGQVIVLAESYQADSKDNCGVGADEACKLYHQLGVAVSADEISLYLFFTHSTGIARIDLTKGIGDHSVGNWWFNEEDAPVVHQLLVVDQSTVYATSLDDGTLTIHSFDGGDYSSSQIAQVQFSPTKPRVVMGEDTVYVPVNSGYIEWKGTTVLDDDSFYFVSQLSYDGSITPTWVLKESKTYAGDNSYSLQIGKSYGNGEIYTNFHYPSISIDSGTIVPGFGDRWLASPGSDGSDGYCLLDAEGCIVTATSDHENVLYKTNPGTYTYYLAKSPTHFVYDFDRNVLVTIAGYGHTSYSTEFMEINAEAFDPDEVIIVSTGVGSIDGPKHVYAGIPNGVRVTHVVPGRNSVWMVGYVVSGGGDDADGQYTEAKDGYMLLQAVFE